MVRTRFAPSPTGYMHIGNLRTALYTYLIAKKDGGKFILRIEDTDQERLVEGATEYIYETLKSVGLIHDEGPDIGGDYGPYVQTERREIYKEYAHKLVEKDGGYYCFCTKERLEDLRHEAEAKGEVFKYDGHCRHLSKEEVAKNLEANMPYVIRQKIKTGENITFDDVVYGHVSVETDTLDDGVMLKTDGLPTYNFANVIDDHLMEITHVVRGSEYLSSTPKYQLLYKSFGWEVPVYVHVPPIMKDAGAKMSKRNKDASFQDYLDMGYLKEAVINFISLLGWSPGGEVEIFDMNFLIENFSISGISKSPAVFDMAKFNWMNGQYIKNLKPEVFCEMAKPWIAKGLKLKADYAKIAKILQTRVDILNEIPEKLGFLDILPDYSIDIYTHKKMKTDATISHTSLIKAKEALASIENWSEETVHETLFALIAEMEIKNGQMLWPVRTALTGMDSTPGGAMEIADILGKDESMRRIEIGIEKLANAL